MAERITAGETATPGASSPLTSPIVTVNGNSANASSTTHFGPSPRSEWIGFPAMGVPQVDELGFKRFVGRIGEESPLGLANDVAIGCGHVGSILRRITDDGCFSDKTLSERAREDLACLIDAALRLLPEEVADSLTETIARSRQDVRNIIQGLMLESSALRLMLKAMEVAARPSSTLEEIDRAATTAHACEHALQDGGTFLTTFAAMVEGRGMVVEWLDLGDTTPRFPRVHASQAALKQWTQGRGAVKRIQKPVSKRINDGDSDSA